MGGALALALLPSAPTPADKPSSTRWQPMAAQGEITPPIVDSPGRMPLRRLFCSNVCSPASIRQRPPARSAISALLLLLALHTFIETLRKYEGARAMDRLSRLRGAVRLGDTRRRDAASSGGFASRERHSLHSISPSHRPSSSRLLAQPALHILCHLCHLWHLWHLGFTPFQASLFLQQPPVSPPNWLACTSLCTSLSVPATPPTVGRPATPRHSPSFCRSIGDGYHARYLERALSHF